MNTARYRIAGVGALGLCALFAAGTVGAASVQAPAPHYVEPASSQFVRVAGLFGESDEERAARLQREQNQDDAIGRLNDKVRDLEDSVRNLTGENESLTHQLGVLNDKIDRQQKDFEYRLCAMAAQQLGSAAGPGDPNAVPCNSSGGSNGGGSGGANSFNTPPQPPATGSSFSGRDLGPVNGADADADASVPNNSGPPGGTTRHMAPPPGVLGTLPAGTDTTPPPRGTTTDDTRTQFSTAMNLLAKARYDEARAAFRSFADTYPKDDLASQAVYWVADITYVQKDYGNAARYFAEVIKKYPTSPRAPDSMLKLGQSLIAAGQKQGGCTALAALPDKYPHAPAAVLDQGAAARKANCRHIS